MGEENDDLRKRASRPRERAAACVVDAPDFNRLGVTLRAMVQAASSSQRTFDPGLGHRCCSRFESVSDSRCSFTPSWNRRQRYCSEIQSERLRFLRPRKPLEYPQAVVGDRVPRWTDRRIPPVFHRPVLRCRYLLKLIDFRRRPQSPSQLPGD